MKFLKGSDFKVCIFCNFAPQLIPTFILQRGEGNHSGSLGKERVGGNGGQIVFAFGGVELVNLGCHNDIGQLTLIHKVDHHFVVNRKADAAVHKLNDDSKTVNALVGSEITVGKGGPCLFFGGGALGKAVAGQVNQKELFVDLYHRRR